MMERVHIMVPIMPTREPMPNTMGFIAIMRCAMPLRNKKPAAAAVPASETAK